MRSKAMMLAILSNFFCLTPVFAQLDEDGLVKLRQSAQKYKIEIQKYFDSRPILTLPDDLDEFPGFKVTKNSSGKNVVLPSGDEEYVRCMRGAWETFGIASTAGIATATIPGAVIGIGAGGTQAILDAHSCAEQNASRLFEVLANLEADGQAKGISVQMDAFSKELTGMQGELIGLRGSVVASQLLIKEQMQKSFNELLSKAVTQEDMEKIVSAGMNHIKDNTRKYFVELRQRQIANDEMSKLQSNIQLTQQGLTSLVNVAFRDNPKLANKINRGIGGAAELAKIGVALSAAANPFTAVMLSLKAMGVMASIFGGGDGGAAFNQIIFDNIQALRKDISEMRDEMRTRFDAIDRSLIVVADYMRSGFIVIDGKLDNLRAALGDIREEGEIRAKIQESAISYLLSGALSVSSQRCLKGDASQSVDRNAYSTCLGDFKLYATDVARLDMIAGSGRIAADPLGTVSNMFYLSVDSGRSIGYLSALNRKITNAPVVAEAPSPLEWVKGVQAYLELLSRYHRLEKVRSEVAKSEIINNEQDNINSMIDAGNEIKKRARYLRRDGIIALIDLYNDETKKFINDIVPIIYRELAKRPLGVTKEQTTRKEWIIQVNGHSSVFSPCGSITREIAGIDDVIASEGDWQSFEHGERCWPSAFTNKDNDAALKQQGLRFARSQSDGEFEIKSLRTKNEATIRIQEKYLEKQIVSKFSPQTLEMLSLSIAATLKSDESSRTMYRLAFLHELILQQIMIGSNDTSDANLPDKIKLVQSLPTSASQIRELIDRLTYKSEKILRVAFSEGMADLFNGEKKRVSDAIRAMPDNDNFPFIEPSLRQLRAVRIN
ncbi:hypothetical protein FF100_29375 [Methylobacterium terricola]|uniref:Uncharacterized protein n=1 Tax=Methylobacterium terricola TaxID=2583531 RepID=A0A5C4L9B5_9HYPH|nr:hypothetical protein [Methylobacterium terricola]TNC08451.1 hypothetical protein FF100_29375 [Methylobacterium terricola]